MAFQAGRAGNPWDRAGEIRSLNAQRSSLNDPLLPLPEQGVGEEADLFGVGERVEVGLAKVEAFAGAEDPVVERARGVQVEPGGPADEKFAEARCMSPSIRLLRRQVQFESRAKSPAVRPATSISLKIASA